MASGAIKAITRGSPPILSVECKRNMFSQRRMKDRPKIFDDSSKKIGKQAIRNHLNFMNDIPFDRLGGLSDECIRRQLKDHFGFGLRTQLQISAYFDFIYKLDILTLKFCNYAQLLQSLMLQLFSIIV